MKIGKLLHTAIFIAIAILFINCTHNKPTIEWDSSSLSHITPGNYARIKCVDNHHALVYNIGSRAYIRFSDDECDTWSEPSIVAQNDKYIYTNCELLQLQNRQLLYMWNARPRKGTNLCYKIMYSLSSNGGKDWSQEQDLYIADSTFNNGCWEPIALQLPDGELQIYFANESPYRESNEQEITLMRSFDNGHSWGKAEKISFRANKRDGMASPIYLPHSNQIAIAIEDNGIRGRFKPVIVRTNNNWEDGCVTSNDLRREEAIAEEYKLHDTIYAGAPYLIRLGDDFTLLSIQSTESRKGRNERYANMQVYVGDKDARNFSNRSTPVPNLAEDGNALWNSIFQINSNTVIAVMDMNSSAAEKRGIWTIKGKIVKNKR